MTFMSFSRILSRHIHRCYRWRLKGRGPDRGTAGNEQRQRNECGKYEERLQTLQSAHGSPQAFEINAVACPRIGALPGTCTPRGPLTLRYVPAKLLAPPPTEVNGNLLLRAPCPQACSS